MDQKEIDKLSPAQKEALEKVIAKEQSVAEVRKNLMEDIGPEARPTITSGKKYDMICYRGKISDDLWDMIRPFTAEEKARHHERFFNTTFGVCSFDNGAGGAWPGKMAMGTPVFGYKGLCRAYKCCCELLPKHFTWERINPNEENEENEDLFAFGGTLTDERIRTADPIFLQRAKTRPQL